jgi:hypothetical protein
MKSLTKEEQSLLQTNVRIQFKVYNVPWYPTGKIKEISKVKEHWNWGLLERQPIVLNLLRNSFKDKTVLITELQDR